MLQASALVTNSAPSNFAHLWTYLTDQPEYQAFEQRRALNKRLREFLLKQWVTIGIPKVAVALFALIKVEKPGDADLGFSKYVTCTFSSATIHIPYSGMILSAIEVPHFRVP